MAATTTKLSIKLLIDSNAKKVVFAEVEKNFVDFLFHILSLPLGRVSKLLKEKGMNGCLHNIYESVENLNSSYMKRSKDMIIKPECPVVISSVPLQLFNYNVPQKKKNVYKCSSAKCSYVMEGVYKICPLCKNSMSMVVSATDGGFVKETVKYMVMDDLVVKPLSVSNIMGHVKDVVALHEEVVQFGIEEALKLLKLSLESNTVLTTLFTSRVKVEN
ncbi:hypothetical protein MTR67_028726 [Solanum verrucosum]|uniref:Uncharacterized protein n=1 Tax=Solanum verrucosum TaxID=315347 RepID=A0AAF0R4L9_SOLVR|nr:hypothetical protein MTR67_028726 [Solanum verrucosum]